MANILSATVFTTKDEHGNPHTEGWLTLEFGEAYQGPNGGIAFDLSRFKRIDYIQTAPISGCVLRAILSSATPASGAFWNSGALVQVIPQVPDYNTPQSTRFQIWAPLNAISGFGVTELTSAPAAAVSGIRFTARVIGQ